MKSRSGTGESQVRARHAPPSRSKDSAGNNADGLSRKDGNNDHSADLPDIASLSACLPVGLAERMQARPLYAALDLGTNNCRLLIAAPAKSGFRVIDAFSRIVRLGEGISRNGVLGEDAIERTIKAVRVCANKLKWWRVNRMRLIATEACRTAGNSEQFIDRLMDEVGIKLEVIDRKTEADLAVAGASPLIAPDARNVLVFDIGGGSTEIMWVAISDDGQYNMVDWISLPDGVVTLAEEFGGRDVTPEVFERMRRKLRPAIQKFAAHLGTDLVPDHLLGTSGTVTTIAGINFGLNHYDRSRVDGCWIDSADAGQVTQELLQMSYDARAESPCIGRDRADLVMAGCAILEEIRHTWPASRIRVADRGLREGILTKMMQEDGNYGRPR